MCGGENMSDSIIMYFGYGSNLNTEDWERWCLDNDFESKGLSEICNARLPNYSLKFHQYSNGRGGGVADIVDMEGECVYGALFEIDVHAREAMDEKEGVRFNTYQPKWIEVMTFEDKIVKALTYVTTTRKRKNHFVAPTKEYVDLIRIGLVERGLPTENLDIASRGENFV
jgi:cation transport regulator ChaC